MNHNYDHLLDCSKVTKCSDGVERVCYPDKYANDLFQVFRTRFDLHNEVYQHRVTKSLEFLIVDALTAAHPYLKVPGTDGVMKTFSEAISDPVAFTRLNDSIIDQIWLHPGEELTEARSLLLRL